MKATRDYRDEQIRFIAIPQQLYASILAYEIDPQGESGTITRAKRATVISFLLLSIVRKADTPLLFLVSGNTLVT